LAEQIKKELSEQNKLKEAEIAKQRSDLEDQRNKFEESKRNAHRKR